MSEDFEQAIEQASAVMVLIHPAYGVGTRTLVEVSKERTRELIADTRGQKPTIFWDASRLVLRPPAQID